MTPTLEFQNIIGGKEILLSSKTFDVASPFYDDYLTKVPDSNLFDLTTSISKAKSYEGECNRLNFEERYDILRRAHTKIDFSNSDIEYIIKMTGMPITSVKKYIHELQSILEIVPKMISKRIGIFHGRIARHPMAGSDLFKFLEPRGGFIYAVTPGNDPRTTSYIASWAVTLGIPCIFKVSKNDLLTSQKIVKSIVDAGYPAGGLQILCWDTSTPESKKLNFTLVDAAKTIWAFGDTNTVDRLLRYEERMIGDSTIFIDHFSDKVVLRHISGRAAAVIDNQVHADKIINIIMESSLAWPLGCNSLKAIFDSNESHNEFLSKLEEQFKQISKYTGDPMDVNTKIGYVNPQVLSVVNKRINDLKRLGLITIKNGEAISEIQSTPYLLATRDIHSEFLSREYPLYLLTIKKCSSFESAIADLNETTGDEKRISVAVFSEDEEKVLKARLHAHHIKRMRHTTELDILFHEGQDYLHKLTEPQIHRVVHPNQ